MKCCWRFGGESSPILVDGLVPPPDLVSAGIESETWSESESAILSVDPACEGETSESLDAGVGASRQV